MRRGRKKKMKVCIYICGSERRREEGRKGRKNWATEGRKGMSDWTRMKEERKNITPSFLFYFLPPFLSFPLFFSSIPTPLFSPHSLSSPFLSTSSSSSVPPFFPSSPLFLPSFLPSLPLHQSFYFPLTSPLILFTPLPCFLPFSSLSSTRILSLPSPPSLPLTFPSPSKVY